MWQAYAITFLVAFAVSAALSPLCARLGLRLGVADRPGGRRRHGRSISRMGGVALYVAFVAAVLVSQQLDVPRLDPNESRRVWGLLAGITIVFILGMVDDLYELNPGPQYLGQALAVAAGMAGLIFIEFVNNPFSTAPDARFEFPWWLTIGVTTFWLMGMMQTVNWLDGLDGLAAGVCAIAALMLFAHSGFRLDPPQQSVALLPLALAGACLGFLPFNFAPAKVFMGGGAFVLGYALGALAIIGGAKVATVLLVMGIPILDVAVLIIWRQLSGNRADVGDRQHLHFRLRDSGLPQKAIVLGYYAMSASFGLLALLLPARQYKVLALVALGAAALGIYAFTARYSRRRLKSLD